MVLQKESVDDELEHFDDIKEDPEEENPHLSKSPSSRDISASEDCRTSVFSKHEDHNHDIEDGLHDDSREKAQAPHSSALPAGYNPRHREPSYWYRSA